MLSGTPIWTLAMSEELMNITSGDDAIEVLDALSHRVR